MKTVVTFSCLLVGLIAYQATAGEEAAVIETQSCAAVTACHGVPVVAACHGSWHARRLARIQARHERIAYRQHLRAARVAARFGCHGVPVVVVADCCQPVPVTGCSGQ